MQIFSFDDDATKPFFPPMHITPSFFPTRVNKAVNKTGALKLFCILFGLGRGGWVFVWELKRSKFPIHVYYKL